MSDKAVQIHTNMTNQLSGASWLWFTCKNSCQFSQNWWSEANQYSSSLWNFVQTKLIEIKNPIVTVQSDAKQNQPALEKLLLYKLGQQCLIVQILRISIFYFFLSLYSAWQHAVAWCFMPSDFTLVQDVRLVERGKFIKLYKLYFVHFCQKVLEKIEKSLPLNELSYSKKLNLYRLEFLWH